MNPVFLDSIFSEQLFVIPTPPTIVINQPWGNIGTDEKVLLSKILGAIKLSLESVSIKFQTSLDISFWMDKPRHLIYFGGPVKGLAQYEVIEANGVSIVASESLKDLLQNDASRKKLWQALKMQFSV